RVVRHRPRRCAVDGEHHLRRPRSSDRIHRIAERFADSLLPRAGTRTADGPLEGTDMKFWMIIALLAGSAVAQEPVLPEGEGKKLVQDICTKCHELDGVVRLHNTKEMWNKVVDEMVGRGAEGTDQQLETIVDYLA